MKLIVDIPNSLYANLQKIQNGSIAAKRILDCVKQGDKSDTERCWITGDYEDADCEECSHKYECSGADVHDD